MSALRSHSSAPPSVRRRARTAGLMLAVGLAAVAFTEWRAWQDERSRTAEPAPAPLPPGPRPRVSVLVAAWGEPEETVRLRRSFVGLRYPDKELVLCAGGGAFEAAANVAGQGVVLLEQRPGEGKWSALRRSLELATGEII